MMLEAVGVKQVCKTVFVLVAGGLGERLGYKGIKVQFLILTNIDRCMSKHGTMEAFHEIISIFLAAGTPF